jgi:hypothetical protein
MLRIFLRNREANVSLFPPQTFVYGYKDQGLCGTCVPNIHAHVLTETDGCKFKCTGAAYVTDRSGCGIPNIHTFYTVYFYVHAHVLKKTDGCKFSAQELLTSRIGVGVVIPWCNRPRRSSVCWMAWLMQVTIIRSLLTKGLDGLDVIINSSPNLDRK